MTDSPDAQAALDELTETLAAVQAEHERLRATSETAEQNVRAFADAITAAAGSLRAVLPQAEQPEQEPA